MRANKKPILRCVVCSTAVRRLAEEDWYGPEFFDRETAICAELKCLHSEAGKAHYEHLRAGLMLYLEDVKDEHAQAYAKRYASFADHLLDLGK